MRKNERFVSAFDYIAMALVVHMWDLKKHTVLCRFWVRQLIDLDLALNEI